MPIKSTLKTDEIANSPKLPYWNFVCITLGRPNIHWIKNGASSNATKDGELSRKIGKNVVIKSLNEKLWLNSKLSIKQTTPNSTT